VLRSIALGALFASDVLTPFVPVERGDQFRAIVRATRDDDTRGLLIVGEGIWGAGGYFYLGRNIPWGTADWATDPFFHQAMARPQINRAVTYDGRCLDELVAAGFQVRERIDRATVLSR
jgi:GPI mannosyltransferase 3